MVYSMQPECLPVEESINWRRIIRGSMECRMWLHAYTGTNTTQNSGKDISIVCVFILENNMYATQKDSTVLFVIVVLNKPDAFLKFLWTVRVYWCAQQQLYIVYLTSKAWIISYVIGFVNDYSLLAFIIVHFRYSFVFVHIFCLLLWNCTWVYFVDMYFTRILHKTEYFEWLQTWEPTHENWVRCWVYFLN